MPTSDTPASRAIRRFRRRLGSLLILERGLRFGSLVAFGAGIFVLVLRAGLGMPTPSWLEMALAAALAIAIAVALAEGLRALPSEPTVRAILDRWQKHGGLLMAEAELEIGSWRRTMVEAEGPRLRWRAGPSLAFALGAIAFLTMSFLVPQRTVAAPGTARPFEIGEEIAELEESLETLREEELLEEEDAERLELELQALAEESSPSDPAHAWETLDQVRETALETAREAVETALEEKERLAAADEIAQALDENVGALPELEARALEELADLARRAAEERQWLDPELAQELAEAAQGADLARLRETLGTSRQQMAAKLERLRGAGLIDPESLRAAEEALAASDDALEAFLAENGLKASLAVCGLPGQGGARHGRGDAAMSWDDPSSSAGTAFQEEVLDPASLAALRRSGLLGLQAAEPSIEGRRPRPDSGTSSLDPAAVEGGAAHTQTVLPRHRGAVQRFFERSADRTPRPPSP